MIKNGQLKMSLSLVIILICTMLPKPAIADDGSAERPIRLYASEQFGPIGRLYSLSPLFIDGRSTHGEKPIWGGELIRTTAGSIVDVNIDLVGRIRLKNAATVRVAALLTTREVARAQHLFVASLIDGDMGVRLQQTAGAYIESCGSAITSSEGASFTIRVRDGQALIDTLSGAVSINTLPPSTTFKGRAAAQAGPGRIPVPVAETPIKVEANATKRVLTLWSKLIPKVSSLTRAFSPRLVSYSTQVPQPDLPAANRRVHFEVEGSIGTITPAEAFTDANGAVEVSLIAGPNRASGKIKAWILPEPGDPGDTTYEKYERAVIVTKAGVFRLRNQLIGAAAVATIIVVVERPQKGPIQQQPPAVIIP
jgi:hypothetical protein